ncbi:MAG: hypothetical protein WCT04_19850 [Planctomycetota bacterium]
MKRKSTLLGRLLLGKDGEKHLDRRLRRIERNQQTIMKFLVREKYQHSDIAAPEFGSGGLGLFSKTGEDGDILHVFAEIGVTNRQFVEIGIQDGSECNTANLAFNFGWGGVLIEGSPEDAEAARRLYSRFPRVSVRHSFVTRDNAKALFKECGAHPEADLFSLDIDGNDYWVWEALDDFRPRLVITECNSLFGPERCVTIPYKQDFHCGHPLHRGYFGASLGAMTTLAQRKGYALLGCSEQTANAFFVRRDCLRGALREVTVQEAYRRNYLGRFSKADVEHVNAMELTDV